MIQIRRPNGEIITLPEHVEEMWYKILDKKHPGWRDLPHDQREMVGEKLFNERVTQFLRRPDCEMAEVMAWLEAQYPPPERPSLARSSSN